DRDYAHRPQRGTDRPGERGAVRRRVPGRRTAHARRAVGGARDAAARARRERASYGTPDLAQDGRDGSGRYLGGAHARHTSRRAIERVDWKAFVERQSVVEAVLRAEPGAVYARMTFATRDAYRHVVERIARRTRRPEREVAETAVRLAADGARRWPDDPARGH